MQGHEFEVLGTNPTSSKQPPVDFVARGASLSPTRNANKRHIDVSEFGDKRGKSPGLLGADKSVANEDLNFSLGIET